MKSFAGIDLGTSSLKVIIVDAGGRILESHTKTYEVEIPENGWVEQNPSHWLEALTDVFFEINKSDSKLLATVAAASVTGQMHGIVPVDKSGKALYHAIIWSDRRNEEELEQLKSQMTLDDWVKITGNCPNISFTLGKIMWFKKHHPDLYEKTAQFLLPKDFIRMNLTDTMETDSSDASATLMMDLHSSSWSEKITSFFEIDFTKLPRIVSPIEVVGAITKKAEEMTGIPERTPVVCGCGDAQAQAIGNGVIDSKNWLCTIGTSGQLFVSTDEPFIEEKGSLHTLAHGNPGKWVLMGATLSAGMSFKWLSESIFNSSMDMKELLDLAETASPGSKQLIFLPYLFGERSPIMDEKAKGAFIGLTNEHTKAEMARAVVEGVLFSLYQSFKIVKNTIGQECKYLLLTGGAAQYDLWVKTAANIFNVPVVRNKSRGGGAYGAAMLAAVGIGEFSNLNGLSQNWGLFEYEEIYRPNPFIHKEYEKLFHAFDSAYQSLKDIFHYLHDWSAENRE